MHVNYKLKWECFLIQHVLVAFDEFQKKKNGKHKIGPKMHARCSCRGEKSELEPKCRSSVGQGFNREAVKRGRGWEGGNCILLHVVEEVAVTCRREGVFLHVVEEVAVTCRREGVCRRGALWKDVDFCRGERRGMGMKRDKS